MQEIPAFHSRFRACGNNGDASAPTNEKFLMRTLFRQRYFGVAVSVTES
jgi:hypothetical protein